MDLDELIALYPATYQAVAFFEGALGKELDCLRDKVARGLTLPQLVKVLSGSVDHVLANEDPPNVPHLLAAKAQMETAEFRSYVAGRLGLV
jgi:hypothetical protein